MVPFIVRKWITAILLAIAVVAMMPASPAEAFCSVEPCCASGPMDCCTIESAPAPSPELVLTETVRVSQPSIVAETITPFLEAVSLEPERGPEDRPFAESPPDRLALLSTYLI